MSEESEHITLANKNHDTLIYLVKEYANHPEWVATVAFYKAVHVVEAVIHSKFRRHSNSHDSRIHELKHPDLRSLHKAYRPLFAASLVARYLVDFSSISFGESSAKAVQYTKFSEYMSSDSLICKLLLTRLRQVEEESLRWLTQVGKESLKRIGNEGHVTECARAIQACGKASTNP